MLALGFRGVCFRNGFVGEIQVSVEDGLIIEGIGCCIDDPGILQQLVVATMCAIVDRIMLRAGLVGSDLHYKKNVSNKQAF